MENKNFDVHVDENGIVRLTVKGMVKKEAVEDLKAWAKKSEETIKAQFDKTGKKVKIIFDLKDLGSEYDGESISILASMAKRNEPYVEKTATFGANWTIRFAEDIVITLAGRKNIKAFSNEEEAAAWLKQ